MTAADVKARNHEHHLLIIADEESFSLRSAKPFASLDTPFRRRRIRFKASRRCAGIASRWPSPITRCRD